MSVEWTKKSRSIPFSVFSSMHIQEIVWLSDYAKTWEKDTICIFSLALWFIKPERDCGSPSDAVIQSDPLDKSNKIKTCPLYNVQKHKSKLEMIVKQVYLSVILFSPLCTQGNPQNKNNIFPKKLLRRRAHSRLIHAVTNRTNIWTLYLPCVSRCQLTFALLQQWWY